MLSKKIDIKTQIGTKLKAARKEANISLRDLEASSGIARGDISNIENGKRNITLSTLSELASYVGLKKIEIDL